MIKNTESIAKELQELGFSDYEARAYIALLQESPATAYEISKIAAIPRPNAYSVLESLAGKRAVKPVSKSPLRYVAVDADTLLARISQQTKQRCERLGTKLNRLSELSKHNDYVWPLEGEFEVAAKIRDMIGTASDHLWIKSLDEFLRPHVHALRSASERGVKLRIILFGSDPSEFRFNTNCTVYLHEGSGIPVGEANALVTITRDFQEAMMASLRDSPYGSYTRNLPVVSLADTMIRHEIYMAEIFQKFGKRIEAEFGPALFELRKKFLPEEQVLSLQRALWRGGTGRRSVS